MAFIGGEGLFNRDSRLVVVEGRKDSVAKVPAERADEVWERGAFRQMNWKP